MRRGVMVLGAALLLGGVGQAQTGSAGGKVPLATGTLGQGLAALGYRWAPTPEIGRLTALGFNADGTVTAAAEPVRAGGGSALVQGTR